LTGFGALRTGVITVVGDTYMFDFSSERTVPLANLATAGTNVCNVSMKHAPIVLSPGDSWVFTYYAASQTGATSFEFELGYWER
jgi:hypothetical protein